ncbi:STAS domain-containing protein [Paenalkalicoccus suaedae]|uniref:Anti-sigma factor antagonist n=1 Tax=Paenalkalicoccus suaedae TaxID=2592382 RepID=A0A859FC70_9BACI|nr:STAS domain-containing protein [Paenalkalicoccus suaedae]QKS70164.1 STAS domain-containing protein [Paenalkalicoccus suaedae]
MIKEIKLIHNDVHVKLHGEVYVSDASLLREKLLPYVEEGKANFHFDFSEVTFIDSAGLGVLVAIHKRATQNNGEVRILNARGSVKEIFTLTRLHHVFQMGE